MKIVYLFVVCICYGIISPLAAQYRFDFEVHDSLDNPSGEPVYVLQFDKISDSQKFCLLQDQISNPEADYLVTKKTLSISYVTNGSCHTYYLRDRELDTFPRKVIIYPKAPAQLRSLDLRLYDPANNPVTNEFFFYETNNPNQAPNPTANHFDGHRLRTKIYKRYLIIYFRIDEQRTGQFIIDCKTDMRANLILQSVFNAPAPLKDRHNITPASKTFDFFNIL
jgi:hypothetical protein